MFNIFWGNPYKIELQRTMPIHVFHNAAKIIPGLALEELARFLREFRIALICPAPGTHLRVNAYLSNCTNHRVNDLTCYFDAAGTAGEHVMLAPGATIRTWREATMQHRAGPNAETVYSNYHMPYSLNIWHCVFVQLMRCLLERSREKQRAWPTFTIISRGRQCRIDGKTTTIPGSGEKAT